MKSTFAIAAAIGLAVASVPAYALSGKLTIVTSYPTDTTATFEKAFEKMPRVARTSRFMKRLGAGAYSLVRT